MRIQKCFDLGPKYPLLLFFNKTHCAVVLNTVIPKPTCGELLLNNDRGPPQQRLANPNDPPGRVVQWEGVIQNVT